MILFHLQTLGAESDVGFSLKFWILNFWEIFLKTIGKFIIFHHIFISCCVISVERDQHLIKTHRHILGNQITYKTMFISAT